MKQLGFRRTKTSVAGHQHCATCHPDLKNGKAREKRVMSTESMLETVAWLKTRPQLVEDHDLGPEPEPSI